MVFISKRSAFAIFMFLAFAVALFYLLFLRAKVELMLDLSSERKDLSFAVVKSQSDYNRARFAVNNLSEKEKSYRRLREVHLSEFGMVVSEKEIPRFLDMLGATARSSRVEVFISGNKISKSKEGDKILIVEFDFVTTYRKLGRLLINLEKVSIPVFVSNLGVESEKSFVREPLLKVKMEVRTYLADV